MLKFKCLCPAASLGLKPTTKDLQEENQRNLNTKVYKYFYCPFLFGYFVRTPLGWQHFTEVEDMVVCGVESCSYLYLYTYKERSENGLKQGLRPESFNHCNKRKKIIQLQ